MQNQKNKTLILTFSGIAVFVIGAIMAFFFLAREGEGKSFFVKNNSAVAAPEVLALASVISKKEATPITEDFFKFIATEGIERNLSADDLAKEGFVENVVLPYMEERAPELYPAAEDIEINIDVTADVDSYLGIMQSHLVIVAGLWQESLETIAKNDVERGRKIVMLSEAEANALLSVKVPPEERAFHIKTIQAVFATKWFLEFGLIDRSDPLASLFYLAGAGEIENMIMDLIKHLNL